ncbi:hypothetical protein IVB44_17840 [Bradyrhizobium sp. 49]|uniref:glyoxalase superfamily protein n=1 Tax=unclassified Bradyrhizobium TaxID=2631580 RepID=UPI001FFA89CE|nr:MULTISPECIES: glyoxalase superfamily protein [unclassified Bradyrhizobium]MCK1266656.1 hypothetical protein [Bradyrhizobium sp. 84]MCK1372860.1 hypothetical protein [Bradyrhizobium sp. 49]
MASLDRSIRVRNAPPDIPGSLYSKEEVTRDFRDAKAMAHTLRSSLSARAVNISHSESLELVSKMFGVADWNTLSAEIESGGQKLLVRSDAPMNRAVRRFFAILCATFLPPETLHALNQASRQQREIVIAVQKTSSVDDPILDDIHHIGVLGGTHASSHRR